MQAYPPCLPCSLFLPLSPVFSLYTNRLQYFLPETFWNVYCVVFQETWAFTRYVALLIFKACASLQWQEEKLIYFFALCINCYKNASTCKVFSLIVQDLIFPNVGISFFFNIVSETTTPLHYYLSSLEIHNWKSNFRFQNCVHVGWLEAAWWARDPDCGPSCHLGTKESVYSLGI